MPSARARHYNSHKSRVTRIPSHFCRPYGEVTAFIEQGWYRKFQVGQKNIGPWHTAHVLQSCLFPSQLGKFTETPILIASQKGGAQSHAKHAHTWSARSLKSLYFVENLPPTVIKAASLHWRRQMRTKRRKTSINIFIKGGKKNAFWAVCSLENIIRRNGRVLRYFSHYVTKAQ